MIPTTNMILFETSASVFELMWDIALVIFIIRIAFVYSTLTFLASCLSTYLRSSPSLFVQLPSALFFPLNILVISFISRLLIQFYEIPRVKGFRLAIGLMGLFFLVVSDAVAGMVVYEKGWGAWAWRTGRTDVVEGLLGLVVFALMPALWMLGEGLTDEMGELGTAHGHERKRVVDVV
jgi:hypothetical protein